MNIPLGYAQVNYFFTGAALPRGAQLTHGIDNTVDDASAMAFDAASALWDNIKSLMPATVTLEKVKVKLGPNATGAEATVPVGVPGELDEAEPMSPNVSILVNKITGLGGRKNAGKLFIPAFPEDDTDGGGLLIAARQTAWQTAMDTVLTALNSSSIGMVVLHTDSTTPTAVGSLLVQQRLATQKRRLRRAGGRRTPTP